LLVEKPQPKPCQRGAMCLLKWCCHVNNPFSWQTIAYMTCLNTIECGASYCIKCIASTCRAWNALLTSFGIREFYRYQNTSGLVYVYVDTWYILVFPWWKATTFHISVKLRT
jgi:hypothetical protein